MLLPVVAVLLRHDARRPGGRAALEVLDAAEVPVVPGAPAMPGREKRSKEILTHTHRVYYCKVLFRFFAFSPRCVLGPS